jgi:hypothetical protein
MENRKMEKGLVLVQKYLISLANVLPLLIIKPHSQYDYENGGF